jgi:hypothetical protein
VKRLNEIAGFAAAAGIPDWDLFRLREADRDASAAIW